MSSTFKHDDPTTWKFVLPHTPNNPSKCVAVQVGSNKDTTSQYVPASVVVFGKKSARGPNEHETTSGPGNKVLVAHTTSTNNGSLIGVTIDGVIDPAGAAKYPSSAGRHSVAVSGSVTVAALVKGTDGKPNTPPLLSTLYVKNEGSGYKTGYRDYEYEMPRFSINPDFRDPGWVRLGVVHWRNANFGRDLIPEVRVHLGMR